MIRFNFILISLLQFCSFNIYSQIKPQTTPVNNPQTNSLQSPKPLPQTPIANTTTAPNQQTAEIVVKVRPAPPVIVRPTAPTGKHLWVNEDWEVRNGQYIFTGNHWTLPPRKYGLWRHGHWEHRGPGWAWMPGHWAY